MNDRAESVADPNRLDARMVSLLKASGPINVVGALIFAPPLPWVRQIFGLPDGHELYLWVMSAWILAFGIGYWSLGVSGRADRTFLAVGAAGKASFALVLIALAGAGRLSPLAAVVGLPDLVIAGMFASWLARTRG